MLFFLNLYNKDKNPAMHKRASDDLIMQSMPKVRKNSAICNGTPLYLYLSQKYSKCEKGTQTRYRNRYIYQNICSKCMFNNFKILSTILLII